MRAAALLLAALIVAGGILALLPVGAGQPTYTVAQVTVALRQHPRQWANRTVLVRGTTVGFGLWGHGDLAAQGTALVDAQSVPMSPAQPMPSLFRPAPAGRLGLLLNAPGATPALLLRGAQPAAPSPLDRLARWVTTTATRLLGRARRANAYTAQGGRGRASIASSSSPRRGARRPLSRPATPLSCADGRPEPLTCPIRRPPPPGLSLSS